MSRRFLVSSASLTAAVLALAACTGSGGNAPTVEPPAPATTAPTETQAPPSPTQTQPPSPTPTPTPTPVITWPLTGLPADSEEEIASRPAIAVKISNDPPFSWPQYGVEFADIVWEIVVEGNITRYMAIFHSQIPEFVEPVRSGRGSDISIAEPLGGILAFSGANAVYLNEIRSSSLQTMVMDLGHPGFSRDTRRLAPWNAVGDMQTFLDNVADDRTMPPPVYFPHAAVPGQGSATLDGSPAIQISAIHNPAWVSIWDWNADDEVYELTRRDAGAPEGPALSADGTRYTAKNVLLISLAGILDPTTGYPRMITENASGTGILASGGKYIDINWSKASATDLFVLTDTAGNPVEFEPGNTWVHTIPYTMGGGWRILESLDDADDEDN
jgi:hypothetical protein